MKQLKITQVAFVIFMMATIVGCMPDPEFTPNNNYSWGNVKVAGEEYTIVDDFGNSLEVSNPDAITGFTNLSNGDRVRVTFIVLQELWQDPFSGAYSYSIELKEFAKASEVNTIFNITDESRDTIGKSLVEGIGSYTQLTKNKLNLDIIYYKVKDGGSHKFTLCYDSESQEPGDEYNEDYKPLILELRNYYGDEVAEDAEFEQVQTFISFDVREIPSLVQGELQEDMYGRKYYDCMLRLNATTESVQNLMFNYYVDESEAVSLGQ